MSDDDDDRVIAAAGRALAEREGGPNGFTLVVDGKPSGKGRPRMTRTGHVYTPAATQSAEERVIAAWTEAGKPRIDGTVCLRLELSLARPKDHFRRDGSLSPKGERCPVPARKPDLDNALKLVMDALSGRAYRDDVDVVSVWAARSWSRDGWERSTVKVWKA